MKKRRISTFDIARLGMLVAVCMILSWLEAQIPAFFAVPGIKLGLTNLVVLLALYRMSASEALAINFVRIMAVGFLFGNGMSIIYSLSGGLCSFAVMFLLKKTGKLRIFTVSMCGGIFHNIGQIIAAMIIIDVKSVYYLPVLWVSGIAAGVVVGLICAECVKHLPDKLFRMNYSG